MGPSEASFDVSFELVERKTDYSLPQLTAFVDVETGWSSQVPQSTVTSAWMTRATIAKSL